MTARTLIIDGDILVYRAAFLAEEDVSFGDEYHSSADMSKAKALFSGRLREMEDKFNCSYVICLSCPTRRYHRHSIYPEYKAPRGKVRRPLLLNDLRAWVESTFVTAIKVGLEADDVVGILATSDVIGGKKCVVSGDKDLLQIPGPHIDLNSGSMELFNVTPAEATRHHYIQTLSGDVVDNYPGCPTIGSGRAALLVDNPLLFYPEERTIKRGPRKGESETVWRTKPTDSVWDSIVSCFVKNGRTEQDALTQARVAKILTADYYDFDTKQPILWEPKV